jgi:CheY-like chemotaxis protein
MEILGIIVPPFLNFIVIFLAATLAWLNRDRIRNFLDTLNVKSVELSKDSVKLTRFELKMSEAYSNRGLDASDTDKREIRNLGEYLAPFAAGRRILWVDDNPTGNKLERAAFVGLEIDVQACRSTEEALRELKEDPKGYDLVISDWSRYPQKEAGLPEGLRLLHEIRSNDGPFRDIPVVFYHGIVRDGSELMRRREFARAQGATGTTASPGELLRWTMAELVRDALLDESGGFADLTV